MWKIGFAGNARNLHSTERQCDGGAVFSLVSHQRELDHFAEIIIRGLIDAPKAWVVGHVSSSPIQRPAGLPPTTAFSVVSFSTPLIGDIIDPHSLNQISKKLNRLTKKFGGFDVFLVSGQYGWRGLYFRACARHPDSTKIFVPEGIGVLAEDTYRHLDSWPALRAYIGNICDQVSSGVELPQLAFQVWRLSTKILPLVFGKGNSETSEVPSCEVAYSFWGAIRLPNMTAKEVVPLKPANSALPGNRRQVAGCLLLHSPVPNPREFWPEVMTALVSRGVTALHLAPHPDRSGYSQLLEAAAQTSGIKIHEISSSGQIEHHLVEHRYDLVIGVASTVLVFLAANFPADPVYCLSGFGETGQNALRGVHSQFFGEILPRAAEAKVLEFWNG